MVTLKDWKTDDRQGASLPVLSAGDFSLDEENSTAVVSSACKFVIPVPLLGQEADHFVCPSGDPQAGELIDDRGNSVGDRALVFFNDRDQSWQAVSGEGAGVIIINEVTPAQAAQLDKKVRSLVHSPAELTFNQIKELLAYSRTALNLSDIYHSTRDYVAQKLVMPTAQLAASPETSGDPSYGLKQRIGSDSYLAVYVPTAFAFSGVATSDQIFTQGGVILEQQGQQRCLQPEVFMRTYRLADGAPIEQVATDIARLNIEKLLDNGDGLIVEMARGDRSK